MPLENPWLVALLSGLAAGVLFGIYRLVLGRRMAQRIRDDGPEHHKAKGAVPTGTGIVFVVLLLAAGVLVTIYGRNDLSSERLGVYVCWAAALMGLLGWVDDSRKVRRGTEGLKARYKLPVMIVVGLALLYLLRVYFADMQLDVQSAASVQPWPVSAPWWLFYPVGLFVWLGALNGANFTDGLDGLLASTTLVVLAGVFYALLDGNEPLVVPAAVGFGALLAFLLLNWKPAMIYMGDTGSLTVGALVAGLFLAKGWWLFLGLAVFVWVVEVASVILQVAVYKTSGRRVLLMSPIHHHFELAGWGERTIVFAFTGLQALGCLVAIVWLRYGLNWGLAGTTLLLGALALMLLKYYRRVR
ncbi:phospho-N-acetylmuramoyl-pentapeptide-transferase [bacterium]|nr:phospho-N-acetylmuramoyl-pentapeptide-transferase [bacterium]